MKNSANPFASRKIAPLSESLATPERSELPYSDPYIKKAQVVRGPADVCDGSWACKDDHFRRNWPAWPAS